MAWMRLTLGLAQEVQEISKLEIVGGSAAGAAAPVQEFRNVRNGRKK